MHSIAINKQQNIIDVLDIIDIFIEKFAVSRNVVIQRQTSRLRRTLIRKHMRPAVNSWLRYMRKEVLKVIDKRMIRKKAVVDVIEDDIDWNAIKGKGETEVGVATMNVMQAAGASVVRLARLKVDFNLFDPQAVDWARKNTSKLVVEVTDETKTILRDMTARGIKEGKTITSLGYDIRRVVGMNTRQVKSLDNYWNKLVEKHGDWTDAHLEKALNRESRRLRNYRARMISQTETHRAHTEAARLGYEQNKVKKLRFLAGATACDICAGLDGHEYTTAKAGGIIPVHPWCLCTWVAVSVPIDSQREEEKLEGETWAKSLNEKEKNAFSMWGGGDFGTIRDAQKTKETDYVMRGWREGYGKINMTTKDAIQNINRALNKSKPYKGTVYRGLSDLDKNVFEEIKKAETFKWDAFTSATTDKNLVGEFLGNRNNVVFKISNKTGVNISETMGVFKTEKEVLMKPKTKYEVIKRRPTVINYQDEKINVFEIELKEL